jgi:hypothetical protein
MATATVTDPQGTHWAVRRKWVHRRLRWRGKAGRSIDLMDGSDLASFGAELPVVGAIFLVVALLLFAIAAVIFVVPAVVFVAELLLIAAFVGLGLFGRVLLGRPWTVEAREKGADHAYEWKVRGWRASGELREAIAQQLQATGLPTGGTRVAPVHEP